MPHITSTMQNQYTDANGVVKVIVQLTILGAATQAERDATGDRDKHATIEIEPVLGSNVQQFQTRIRDGAAAWAAAQTPPITITSHTLIGAVALL